MDEGINFDENEESIQIDSGDNGVNHNPFINYDEPEQNLSQPYADSPAP
jgi:biotin synthase-related radical SAM superfamily protein